jgi:hypothetical protein
MYPSGFNSKETKKVVASLATSPPIGFFEIVLCCFLLYRLLRHFKPANWNILEKKLIKLRTEPAILLVETGEKVCKYCGVRVLAVSSPA